MKIVKFGGKLWQTEKASVLDIIERKKSKKKIAIVVSARGKQLMSWTIFLLLQPKRKLQL
jgi:aspartokinase